MAARSSVAAHRRKVAAARKSGRLKRTPKCRACFMLTCIPCGRLKSERAEEYGDVETQHCERHCRNKKVELAPVLGEATG